jgi:DNA-binding GntR family transcriptional regulator
MHRFCDQIEAAVVQQDVVAALDADEGLLETLYTFTHNLVLLDIIQGLWRRCRPYKIIGARRAFDEADHSLWEFQPRLVEAARRGATAEAAQITQESMMSATERIQREIEEHTEGGVPVHTSTTG